MSVGKKFVRHSELVRIEKHTIDDSVASLLRGVKKADCGSDTGNCVNSKVCQEDGHCMYLVP